MATGHFRRPAISDLAWVLTCVVFVFLCSHILAHASEPPFLTGLRPPSAEEAAWVKSHAVQRSAPKRIRAALPPLVKNTEFLPAVKRQTLPNCGAFAPTYYMKTYLEARKHGWGRVNPTTHPERATSPGIAYVFGQSDVHGGSISGSIRVMQEVGALPLSRLPDSYDYQRTTYPPARFFLEAMPHRAGEMIVFDDIASDDGVAALKEWLADGEIAVFALPISLATYDYGGEAPVPDVDNGVIYGLGGVRYDDHAFTLIGYDDSKAYNDGTGSKQGAFFAVNSWGTGWGVEAPEIGTRGFMWIGYDYFRARATRVTSMSLSDDPPPSVAGIFEYEHPYSPQVQLLFWGGEKTDSDWEHPWIRSNPSENAAYNASHPLAMSFSGAEEEQSEAFWWRIFNIGSIPGLPHPAAKGTAHTFRVYRYEDILNAFPETLFVSRDQQLTWHITPLTNINLPHLEAEGLPVESVLLPNFMDLSVGMMDNGEEILDQPMVSGSALFADLNGNGLQDLVALSGTTEVYENLGGSFRKVEGHGIPNVSNSAAAVGDFNRDGLPDIAVCGSIASDSGPVRITRVYKNLGDFRFQDVGADLPGVDGSTMGMRASMAWGDFDNDGLEDLAFWGFGEADSKRIHVFRNLGDGAFEPAAFQLPERRGARLAWMDFNADGRLDLAAGSHVFLNLGNGLLSTVPIGFADEHDYGVGTGLWADFTGNGLPDLARNETFLVYNGTAFTPSQRIRFYRNLGNGTLEDTGTILPKVGFALMEAADYNNTGRMDLIAAHQTGNFGGMSATTPRATSFFRQLPDGSFRSAGFDLIGTTEGGVALADVDGDGDLDVITTGFIQSTEGWPTASRLYRSRFAQSPWGSQANTPPDPPENLDAPHDSAGGRTTFRWDHGTDAETPQAALAYNVRIGTWPGADNIISSASSAPVTSTVRTYRLAPDQPGLVLRDLRPGHYYWSVRTVDGGRMASEWTSEQILRIPGGDIRDVNRDGRFDVADLVLFSRMVDAAREVLPLEYDFNEDGVINQADVRTLAKMLAGSADPFPGSYPVGPGGGIVAQDGLELVIPAGAFPADPPVTLTIERVGAGEAFGNVESPVAYRITGLPMNTEGTMTVLLEPGESGAMGAPFVFVGEELLARGATEPGMRYRVTSPEVLPDGRWRIEIPALPPEGEGLEGMRIVRGDENTYSLNLGVLGGYAKYAGDRFSIAFPQAFVGDQVENLMDGFERCYTSLKDTYEFSYAGRTRWPAEVCVRDLGPNEDGAMLSSTWGDNYGSIEINSSILADSEKSRATACHEFFHLVQGLYDPRGRVAKAYRMSRHYWLDEAMSTWAETLVVSNPGEYRPETYRDNLSAPYLGVATGITGGVGTVMEYGYGMSPLVKYLVQRKGESAPLAAYQAISEGEDSVAALRAAEPDTLLFLWYDQFYSDLLEGKIFPASLGELNTIVGASRLLIFERDMQATWRRFPVKTTDLSAALHMVGFRSDYDDPAADAFFAVRHEGDPSLGIQIFQASNTEDPEWLEGVFGPEEVKFTTIADAKAYKTAQRRLLVLASNTNDDAPYTREREGTLALGLARPGPLSLQANTVSGVAYGRTFPTFAGSGRIEAEAFSDLKETPGQYFHMVQGAAWGGATVDLKLVYGATIDPPTISWTEDGKNVTVSTSGIKTYKISKTDGDGNVLWDITDDHGEFLLVLDQEDRERGFSVFEIRAIYPLTYQKEGEAPSTTTAEWPLAMFLFVQP